MASIHGIAYLVIGIVVAVFSYFVKNYTGDERLIMDLFMYFGIILIVIGIVKLLMKVVKKPKKEIHKHHVEHHEKPVHHYKTHPAQEHHKTHQTHHKIVYCSSCGTKNYSTSNFCHKCGKALH